MTNIKLCYRIIHGKQFIIPYSCYTCSQGHNQEIWRETKSDCNHLHFRCRRDYWGVPGNLILVNLPNYHISFACWATVQIFTVEVQCKYNENTACQEKVQWLIVNSHSLYSIAVLYCKFNSNCWYDAVFITTLVVYLFTSLADFWLDIIVQVRDLE